jgi:hypothetical protein
MPSIRLTGHRLVVAMMALLIAITALPAPSMAQDDGPQVTWQQYDVTVQVDQDGTLRVTESIVIDFNGVFRQGKRTIPMDRIESIDEVEVAVGAVPGDVAASRPVDQSTSLDPGEFNARRVGGDFVITYGFDRTSSGGEDRVRAVEISYTAHGAIRDYPDATPPEQQVRWTAISEDVTATGPIDAASLTIVLPDAVPEDQLAIDPNPTTVEADRIVWERSGLGEGDALRGAVAFPPITSATAPAWQADADTYEGRQEMLPGIHLTLGMLAFVVSVIMILTMVVRGVRDPEVGLVADIIPQRPDDLPAPLAGTLIDETVDLKDVMAGMLDLERNGFVTLGEGKKKKRGKPTYTIRLNTPVDEAPSWHRPMLEGLFSGGADVGKDVDLADRMKKMRQTALSAIWRAYEKELFERGYFIELPHKTRARWGWIIAGVFIVFAAILAGVSIWAQQVSPFLAVPAIIVVVGAIVAAILTTRAAVKTTEGAVEAAKWKAYGRYLKDLRTGPTPERFLEEVELNLPWAVALGFDSSWAKLADDMAVSDARHNRGRRDRHTWHTSVFVGGPGRDSSASSASSGGSGSGGGGLQGASASTLAAIGGGSSGIFSMLNTAAAGFNAGASTGSSGSSSSSGGFSGSSSIGSSGGGGHSFS